MKSKMKQINRMILFYNQTIVLIFLSILLYSCSSRGYSSVPKCYKGIFVRDSFCLNNCPKEIDKFPNFTPYSYWISSDSSVQYWIFWTTDFGQKKHPDHSFKILNNNTKKFCTTDEIYFSGFWSSLRRSENYDCIQYDIGGKSIYKKPVKPYIDGIILFNRKYPDKPGNFEFINEEIIYTGEDKNNFVVITVNLEIDMANLSELNTMIASRWSQGEYVYGKTITKYIYNLDLQLVTKEIILEDEALIYINDCYKQKALKEIKQ